MDEFANSARTVWKDRIWHHAVREALGERLYYYLVRCEPFDPDAVKTYFTTAIKSGLHGIRGFQLFGSRDLLIRAWLHPMAKDDFEAVLKKIPEVRSNPDELYVNRIEHRWYWQGADGTKVQPDLRGLTEESIRRAQSGDLSMISRLEASRAIINRGDASVPTIKFFIDVTFTGNLTNKVLEPAISAITALAASQPSIFATSIYRLTGRGLLIKGQVTPNKYFDVSPLANEIVRHARGIVSTTNTYLVPDADALFGDSLISEKTFKMRGRRRLVLDRLVPEIYQGDDVSQVTTDRLEAFVEMNWPKPEATSDEEAFCETCFKAIVRCRFEDVGKELGSYLGKAERALRLSAPAYVGLLTGGKPEDLLSNRKKSGDQQLSLGDLIEACVRASQQGAGKIEPLHADWSAIAKIRNDVAHANADFEKDWEDVLRRFLIHGSELAACVASVSAFVASRKAK